MIYSLSINLCFPLYYWPILLCFVGLPVVVTEPSYVPELAVPHLVAHYVPSVGRHVGVEGLPGRSAAAQVVAHGVPAGAHVAHIHVVQLTVVVHSHFGGLQENGRSERVSGEVRRFSVSYLPEPWPACRSQSSPCSPAAGPCPASQPAADWTAAW